MSVAEAPSTEHHSKPARTYGIYQGYPIVDVRMEWRGLNGGLTAAASIEGAKVVTPPDEFAFIAAKGQKISNDYDFVRNDAGEITGVILIQVYKHVGVAFTDEEASGVAINSTLERIAQAEAEKKNAFPLEFPVPDSKEKGNVTSIAGRNGQK
jgi:hypothetical protein